MKTVNRMPRHNVGRCGGQMERASDPTEGEIAAACDRYRSAWTDEEREIRRRYYGKELGYRLLAMRYVDG